MKLELYHREPCPFSAKVRNFINQNKLQPKIKYHDIDTDEDSYRALLQLTDDEQVPCLVVDGRPILESDDIIAWLSKNKSEILRENSASPSL